MIGDVATTDFVMQKLFTAQKKKHLHKKHGLDVFINKWLIIIILRFYHFETLTKFQCHIFLELRCSIKVTSP